MKQKLCIICAKVISNVRLEAQPLSKTCRRRCADVRRKNVRREIDKRYRQRKEKGEEMNKAKVISRDMLPRGPGSRKGAITRELCEAIVATLGTNNAVEIPNVDGVKMASHRKNLYYWALRNNLRGQVRTQVKDGILFAWLEGDK